MPDPKLQKLADYLRANYVPAAQRPPPVVLPPTPPQLVAPMDPAAYRVDRFMRRVAQPPAPAQSPALQRQLLLAQVLRGPARASGEEIPQ